MIDAKNLFDAIRVIKGAPLTQDEVAQINAIIAPLSPKLPVMATSQAGLALIREFEGCKLAAYPDPATKGDPWTVGVGHTGPEVHKGMVITEAQADAFLAADLGSAEAAVRHLCPITTQYQFDALVSFTFNLGEGALEKSTLREMHNQGYYEAAAGQFPRWNKAAGREMAGLTRRRMAEAALYRGKT